ncbi:MAG: hypothetical protein M3417_12570 [Actinomycetota bacterium]|nr:hypothetical protein [Actinomycetota bacterium]
MVRQLSAQFRQCSAQLRMTASSPPICSHDAAQRSQATAQEPQYFECSWEPRSMKSRLASQACAQSSRALMCSGSACSPPMPRQCTSVSVQTSWHSEQRWMQWCISSAMGSAFR